jgi:Protein of unknown function (DUF551)
MSNQWISVKDRLPDDNESYLVCDFQVMHWMPFPPPPEETKKKP